MNAHELTRDLALPDPLTDALGRAVRSSDQWPRRRRELMEWFAAKVYGRTPRDSVAIRSQVVESSDDALNPG